MAVNRDRRVEVLIRERALILKCIFVSGPPAFAGYLLQLEVITRQQYENFTVPQKRNQRPRRFLDYSKEPLIKAVELKIESNPDLYFPRFIQALRWSGQDFLADRLEQVLPEQEQCMPRINYYRFISTAPYDIMYCIQSYLYKI